MRMKEKVVRPGGLELPTFWFVAVRPILPNLARGVANRTDSASWGNSVQSAFSFFFRPLLRNCRHFPHLALHFRDSCPHCPKTYRALELHRVTGTRRIINMHAKTPEISPLPALDGGEPELW